MSNVFTVRNFRLVYFGALVSELGTVLYSFAVSFYILEITGNNAFLQGLYLALCGVVLLCVTPIGGVLGDRYNKAAIMSICDYLKGAIIILATLGMLMLRTNKAHLVILFITGILGNAVSGIFSPAAGSLLPHIVDENSLQQANAYYSVKNSLQSIFGVVLAGVLYSVLSITTLFLIVGICYILSGISEMFIRYCYVKPTNKLSLKVVASDMGEGFRYLMAKRAIMVLMGAILFINFFFHPLTGNFLPYFIKTDLTVSSSYLFDSFLTPEQWSSSLSMLFGVASLFTSFFISARPQEEKAGRKTAVKIGVMAVVIIIYSICYWVLVERGTSLNSFLVVLIFGFLTIGCLIPMINIPVGTTIMRIVDKDKLSKVTSITSIISQGLIPISSVVAGAVIQFWGTSVLLFMCSAGFAVTTLFMLLSREVGNV
jgi:MFS family permease